MRPTMVLGIGAVLLASVSGCGGSAPDALMKEQLAGMQEAAAILETIKDESSAEAALPKLEKVAARVEATNKKGKEELKMSDDDKKKFLAKYQTQAQEVSHKVALLLQDAQAAAPQKAKRFEEIKTKLGYTHAPFKAVGTAISGK